MAITDLSGLPQPTTPPVNPIEARQGDVFAQTVDTGKIARQTRAFDVQSDVQEAFKTQVSQQVQAQYSQVKAIEQQTAQVKAESEQIRAQVTQVRQQASQIKQQAISAVQQAQSQYNSEMGKLTQELTAMQAKFNETLKAKEVAPVTPSQATNLNSVSQQEMDNEIAIFKRLNPHVGEITSFSKPELWNNIRESALNRKRNATT
jgi:vacuolar-type H+-ATPase subunit I/STV1